MKKKSLKSIRATEYAKLLTTLREDLLAEIAGKEIVTPAPPVVARRVIKRRMTRIEALSDRAAKLDLTIDTRATPSHVKEIRFLAGDALRFVAHGITQAEIWLAGFMQAKVA